MRYAKRIRSQIQARAQEGLSRSLLVANQNLKVDFTTNDYLGLSQHPEVVARSQDYLLRYGVGARGSRLTCGTFKEHVLLEERIADLKGTESALLFASGYQANMTILSALATKDTVFLLDKLSHNSLIKGTQGHSAKLLRFQHNDEKSLKKRLEQVACHQDVWVVTESVFGMDGDFAELEAITRLCRLNGAALYVDEAHATGVFGDNGMGLSASFEGIDLSMGTFSKGAGGFGAYIAGSKELIDFLINFCGGFIYSTALPPAVLGAIHGALDLLPSMKEERESLQRKGSFLRTELKKRGLDTACSTSHIVPLILGEIELCESWKRTLLSHGINVIVIRPPTVPNGTSRLRLSVCNTHTYDDLNYLLEVLDQCQKVHPIY